MRELLEELKAVLEKHSATIVLKEKEGFLELELQTGIGIHVLDSGSRDLFFSSETIGWDLDELVENN